MPDLQHFLPLLDQGLEQLQLRIARATPHRPVVDRSPNIREAGRDEVLIGVGNFAAPASGALPGSGICLNNKTAGPALGAGAPFGSVTDLVLRAPPDLAENWRKIVGEDASPDRFFARFTLIVEDASPDSCFGLLCFLMRMRGIANEQILEDWVRYVEDWEKGEIVVGDSIYSAYGCLHNALVHGNIEHDPAGAWLDGLHLMRDALGSGCSPIAVPRSIASATITKARALLTFEEQAYQESLAHATCIQLALPIAGTKSTRRRLVDAYLAEEVLPVGSLKAFARTDRVRPSLKNGFTVLAIHRPIATGDGNDFTVSVDTSSGVELRELWLELERLEDARWGPERPCDAPRRQIIGYPDGKRPDQRNAPNQPWYDGGDYSLVAAPRKLADGRLGSRLQWADTCEALWQVYQPFRDLRLVAGVAAVALTRPPTENELRRPEECFPEALQYDGQEGRFGARPRLFIAGWYRSDNSEPAFNVTPTLCRYLAACIRYAPAEAGSISLARLPAEDSYDVLKLPGGIAVISEFGAFVVDDGNHLLSLEELTAEFERAHHIRLRIAEGAAEIGRLLDKTQAFLTGRRPDLSEEDLLYRLSKEQIDTALELHRAHAAVTPPAAFQFRQGLLKRWGIEGWLDSLARDIEQIREVLHGKSDLDMARRVAFLHTYGIPVGVAIGIMEFGVGKDAAELRFDGIHWAELGLFVALSLLVFVIMELIRWFRRRIGLRSREGRNVSR
jgi:hypothetical protein